MAIDIRGLGAQDALSQIAKLAYGSGRMEKTSGGKGSIGMLNGRVVKFNTHWRERGGAPTPEMRASCDALRARLSGIATAMLAAQPGADAATRTKLDKALAAVRRELGMDASGQQVATTRLLDRTVVATVLNTIQKTTGFDAWQQLRAGDARAFASHKVDTSFGVVDYGVRVTDAIASAVQDIAHPADGKPGVALNARQTAFLQDLVRRDLDAKRAAGLPLPSAADLAADVRAFSSKYLVVTLQVFGLNSQRLVTARPDIRHWEQSAVALAGAPERERTDRADVAAGLLEGGDDAGWYAGLAMALVSEKMPEMRARQPEGRLTGATVWEACFGERPPPGAAGVLGARAYADAFVARLQDLMLEMRDRCAAPEVRDRPLDYILTVTVASVHNGMAFTPLMRGALKDPTFAPDVRRDFVSDSSLYNVEDACLKTPHDLEAHLQADFVRQNPVIRVRNGDAEQVFDYRNLGRVRGVDDRADPAAIARAKVRAAAATAQEVKRFIAQLDNLYGRQITPAQRMVMFMGLTQAGFGPFVALVGVGGEHMQAQVDVRREDDGALVMAYSSMPDAAIEARYSFRIEPDGTNRRVGDLVSRRREPAVEG